MMYAKIRSKVIGAFRAIGKRDRSRVWLFGRQGKYFCKVAFSGRAVRLHTKSNMIVNRLRALFLQSGRRENC